MKPLVLFQCGNIISSPWQESKDVANSIRHFNQFDTVVSPQQTKIIQYQKIENSLVFEGSDTGFVINKAFVSSDNKLYSYFSKDIDIDFIIGELSNNKECKGIGFGSLVRELDNNNTSPNTLHIGRYYTRKSHLGSIHPPTTSAPIIDLKTKEIIEPENNNEIEIITWFFAFKMDNLDIFVIILNPNLLTLGNNLEKSNTRYRTRVLDNYLGNFGKVFLKPSFSSRVLQIDNNIYSSSENTFEFYIAGYSMILHDYFETNTYSLGYIENFSKHLVDIYSDLDILHVSGNKYTATFKKDQNTAVLNFRMNTNTALDYASIMGNNRLIHTVTIHNNKLTRYR
jgi:hypothetical protein